MASETIGTYLLHPIIGNLLVIKIHESKLEKMMAFEPKMTVTEVCAEIRHKLHDTLLKGLGDTEDYGLFQLNKDDPKTGVWLDPQKPLSYYMLENKAQLEYRKRLRILRVRMLDGMVKALMVDDSHAVGQLMIPICQSFGITNHEEHSLVWENRPKEVIEKERWTNKFKVKKFDPNETVKDTKMQELAAKLNLKDTAAWVNHTMTLRQQGIVETEILLLKRKLFFNAIQCFKNPLQRNLIYEQAKQSIIKGKHPVTEDIAVKFAALQVQIQFGDYKESIHKPGSFCLRLAEFLDQSYVKRSGIEKKILKEHKRQHQGLSEGDSKEDYIKLARGLPTYGTHFFLVKEQVKGKNKLEPRMLGITKDAVLRLDERTKEILQTWPLEQVKRWAGTQNIFTIDFGEYQDGFYSVQTPDGDKISEIIAGYIDIIVKNRNVVSQSCGDGTEHGVMNDDGTGKNIEAQMLVTRTFVGGEKAQNVVLSAPQKALVTTIQDGKRSITDSIANLRNPAELTGDLSSQEWKDCQLNSSKQNGVIQLSAMNAAIAQMYLLSGTGENADHDAIGGAVMTITHNMLEMVASVQLISALMEDDGASPKDLMDATQALCSGFADLFVAAEPNQPRAGMFSAARQVGNRSKRVLNTISNVYFQSHLQNQSIINDLVKIVAAAIDKMMENAKGLAEKCQDVST